MLLDANLGIIEEKSIKVRFYSLPTSRNDIRFESRPPFWRIEVIKVEEEHTHKKIELVPKSSTLKVKEFAFFWLFNSYVLQPFSYISLLGVY